MDFDLSVILNALSGVNPVWAAVAAAVVFFLRSNGWLKVPTSLGTAKEEANPLTERLKVKVVQKYEELVQSGADDDDAYKGILDCVRAVEVEGTADDSV